MRGLQSSAGGRRRRQAARHDCFIAVAGVQRIHLPCMHERGEPAGAVRLPRWPQSLRERTRKRGRGSCKGAMAQRGRSSSSTVRGQSPPALPSEARRPCSQPTGPRCVRAASQQPQSIIAVNTMAGASRNRRSMQAALPAASTAPGPRALAAAPVVERPGLHPVRGLHLCLGRLLCQAGQAGAAGAGHLRNHLCALPAVHRRQRGRRARPPAPGPPAPRAPAGATRPAGHHRHGALLRLAGQASRLLACRLGGTTWLLLPAQCPPSAKPQAPPPPQSAESRWPRSRF